MENENLKTEQAKDNIVKPDVSSSADIDIPKDAIRLRKQKFLQNIDRWFCPDCGATGDFDTLDWHSNDKRGGYQKERYEYDEDDVVQYCCGECFEENLYATLHKDE